MADTKDHGDFGYEQGSTWHRIMTRGTAKEKRELEKWLDEARADEKSMTEWSRDSGVPIGAAVEKDGGEGNHTRETLTPDVDEYLRRRGYNPEAEDDE